ncbi:hypothetical protein KA405_00055 [Patescibacteria group bacterium]|nr:hypothetical protein [Patescibacteria group bacterium]
MSVAQATAPAQTFAAPVLISFIPSLIVALAQLPQEQHDPSVHVLHAAHVQKHRAPLPHTNIDAAITKNTHANTVSGVVHHNEFNAKIIITTVNHAPILVSLQHPETRNNHAIISPNVAIQNHVLIDKNVSHIWCHAPPTMVIMSGVTLSFIIPIASIPTQISKRNAPRILLHRGEHCFIVKNNDKRNDISVLLLCTYSKMY